MIELGVIVTTENNEELHNEIAKLEYLLSDEKQARELEARQAIDTIAEAQELASTESLKLQETIAILEQERMARKQLTKYLKHQSELVNNQLAIESKAHDKDVEEAGQALADEHQAHVNEVSDLLTQLQTEVSLHQEDVKKLMGDLEHEQETRREISKRLQNEQNVLQKTTVSLKESEHMKEHVLRLVDVMKRANESTLDRLNEQLKLEREMREEGQKQATKIQQDADDQVQAVNQEMLALKLELAKALQALKKEQLEHVYTKRLLASEKSQHINELNLQAANLKKEQQQLEQEERIAKQKIKAQEHIDKTGESGQHWDAESTD